MKIRINISSIYENFTVLVKALLIFPLIYSISLSEKYGSITTERVSLIILFIYTLAFRAKKIEDSYSKRTINNNLLFQVFLFIYTTIILLAFGSGTGITISSYIVNFIIIVPIEFYCIVCLVKDTDELMRILFIISMVQALIILGTLISPQFASFIDTTFNSVNSYYDYSYMRKVWYPGGISCITSIGALKLSLGILSGMYFVQKGNNSLLYFISTIFIIAISSIVARTGLIIGVVAVGLFFFNSKYKKSNVILMIIAVLVIGFMGIFLYSLGTGNGLGANAVFTRIKALQTNGISYFFNAYFHSETTEIPPLSWKTIIGTGIVSGESGSGVYINVDGGFLRMYCAFGLPISIIFYYMIFSRMIRGRIISRNNPELYYIFTLLIAIMIIGEFKEPYFYTRYIFIIYYVILYFYEKSEYVLN